MPQWPEKDFQTLTEKSQRVGELRASKTPGHILTLGQDHLILSHTHTLEKTPPLVTTEENKAPAHGLRVSTGRMALRGLRRCEK